MSAPIQKIPLSNVCKKVTVGHVGTTSKYYTDDGITFIRTQNVTNNGLNLKGVRYITNEFHESLSKSSVEPGDLLLSRVVTDEMKSVIIPDNIGEANCANVILIRPDEMLLSKYLRYLIYSPQSQKYLLGKRVGAAQQVVNTKVLKDWVIDIPPIPEQKRIVALLDTVFADLEQARAKTEQNLKNASELFDSYLQQVFSQKGEGWVETTLGSEINLLTGFAFKSKEYVTHSNSTPLIRGDNVVQGKLRWDGVKLWSNDTISDYQKYQLEVDDIVIAMDRTWVKAGMKFSKITSEDLPALLVQRVARLRALDSINSDYLYHLVGSKLFESYVLSIQTGLGVPHISGKQIQAFSFNKPDIEQQKILVITMNNLKNEVSKLDVIYHKKLVAIDELKKSILQKAFSGELTATAK